MDSNAVAFLRAILPEGGWYAAWTKIGNRKYNTFFATIEELAAHIAAEDAAGKTVYHACSSFRESGSRKANNVWGVKAFWFDIETGDDGDPYDSLSSAYAAVTNFASRCGLPLPSVVVNSGGGIHIYWALQQSLHIDDWKPYATALKRAAEQTGLVIDPARTSDAASVLRTPGTHNRKYQPPRLVECGSLEGPYDVGLFDSLIDGVSRLHNRICHDGISPLTQALIVEPEYAPVASNTIADRCAQIASLRDTRGNIPEPLWYACLGVMSRCQDGQEKAHAWSAGYDGYNYEETQNKFDRTKSLTGATTCAKFESLNAAGCAGCVFRGKITSPISLRLPSAIGVHVGNDERNRLAPIAPTSVFEPNHERDSELPVLHDPFAWRGGTLVFVTQKGDEQTDVLISTHPIFLAGIGVGEVHDDRFSIHFRQWLPHRGWSDLHIGAGKLMGSSGISELAERGAVIHDHKLFLNYVRAATDEYHAAEKLKMHYDQCGWKDDETAFLVGDALYTSQGVQENVIVSQELSTRAQWLGPQQGSLEGWSGAANSLFAAGCEAQSFALACAFAAPLMRFQATDEGGAVVNLLSRGSGTGKTTALAAIYSAWGRKQGLSLTKIDTRVSKAITLGVLGNLPVVHDEMGNRDPEIIREFIMTFTEGRDKMRGTAEGTVHHVQSRWQTLMLTASNTSIHDLLAHSGGSDALAYRVLEFRCALPEGVVAAKGDRLRKEMENNAGWAGDAYIDYLMQPGVLPWARQALETWTAQLWEKAGNQPEQRFWMRAIGAVAVASTLVNNAGILQFNPRRIVDWALDSLLGQDGDATTPKLTNVQKSIGALSYFLSENNDKVLVMRTAYKQGSRTKDLPLVRPLRHLFMRYDTDTGRLLVSEQMLRLWLLEKEIGAREVLDDLQKIDVVVNRRKYATLSAGVDLPGGQQPCIEINGNHPALSGALVPVEKLFVEQDNERKAG